MSKPIKRSNSGRVIAILVVLAVIGGAAAFGLSSLRKDGGGLSDHPMFAVRRGPLTINVTETGVIKNRQQVTIKNRVEGTTTILYIIPEGTQVKEGDLLVELDSSSLNEQLVDREIRVQNAEASFIRATENLAVVKNQAAADVALAELTYQFAQDDLKQYLEGEYPKQETELNSRIQLAMEELTRAENKLTWSKRLFDEKYISATELEADVLTHSKMQTNLKLARNDLELLEKFTRPRRLAELNSEVEQTRMALERVQRRAHADIIQAEADLRARESEFEREKSRLARTKEQISYTRVTAPTSGLVVYGTTGQGGWRGNAEPLAEGQTVRERQDLIFLPTASAVMVEVKIHESHLDKISLNLPVRITVDAQPGKSYTGRVVRIAPLPDAQSVFLNPDLKVYHTEIHVDGDGSDLRTGMNCRADIQVARYDDALHVPVQSVVRIGRQPTVYVRSGSQLEARPVEIGLDNNSMVHILSGLSEGELVSVTPPLSQSSVPTQDPQDSPAATGEKQPAPSAPGAASDAGAANPAAANEAENEQQPRAEPTAEQREEIRRRLENATPEEREAMMRMRQQRQSRQRPQEQP